MKQLLLSSLVGGIILFIWGWLSWSVFPIHSGAILNIGDEDAVISAMHINMEQKGVYVFPGMPPAQDQTAADEWVQKYQRGPVGMIIYDPDGSEPMMPYQMIVGLFIGMLSSFIAAWFLSRSVAVTSSYFAKVAYCGMLGIFISVVVHLTNWNWMGYPLDYTVSWIMDAVIGWVLAGLGIGSIMKSPKAAAEQQI